MAGVPKAPGRRLAAGIFVKLNDLLGCFVRFAKPISVGKGSRVNWLKIGARGGGSVKIGRNSIVNCRIDFDDPNGVVKIGDRCFLGSSHLVCHTGLTIGDDVIISWGVTVVDHDSHSPVWDNRQNDVTDWLDGIKRWDRVAVQQVTIGDRTWIGFGASLLKGVTIGEGAVIGACSVVTADVPSYTIVAGNPARIIRHLDGSISK